MSCASDKGTIHVFKMLDEGNKKSSLSAISGMLSYFGSKWSIAQLKVKDQNCKCALFDNKLFAISNVGNYFMCNLTEDG